MDIISRLLLSFCAGMLTFLMGKIPMLLHSMYCAICHVVVELRLYVLDFTFLTALFSQSRKLIIWIRSNDSSNVVFDIP